VELDGKRHWTVELDVMRSLRGNHHVLAGVDGDRVAGFVFEDEPQRAGVHHEPTPHIASDLVST